MKQAVKVLDRQLWRLKLHRADIAWAAMLLPSLFTCKGEVVIQFLSEPNLGLFGGCPSRLPLMQLWFLRFPYSLCGKTAKLTWTTWEPLARNDFQAVLGFYWNLLFLCYGTDLWQLSVTLQSLWLRFIYDSEADVRLWVLCLRCSAEAQFCRRWALILMPLQSVSQQTPKIRSPLWTSCPQSVS